MIEEVVILLIDIRGRVTGTGRGYQGCDSYMRSVAGLDNNRMPGGQIFNSKTNPSAIKGGGEYQTVRGPVPSLHGRGRGTGAVQHRLDGSLEGGAEGPRELQVPIVRIAGYNSLFFELSKEVQDDIIKRMEHTQV